MVSSLLLDVSGKPVEDVDKLADKVVDDLEASSVGGEPDKNDAIRAQVEAWFAELGTKSPQERASEVAQTYANMLRLAEMAVHNENKIQGLQRFLMALVYRNAGDLVIPDSELDDLDGLFSISRTVDGTGTSLSIRPHPPVTAPS